VSEGFSKSESEEAVTDLGVRLVKAQILPRISRAKLEVLLTNFVARAVEADQDARFLYRFETIAVFGSYLRRDEHDFGDLDLAVSTGLKPEFDSLDDDLLTRRHLSHFPADERCHWRWAAHKRLLRSAKGGKRRLDFISFDELLELGSRYAIVRKAP
jgi:predicted nucleotidyltransferase